MRYKITVVFVLLGSIFAGWLIWYFFFNVYEVKFVIVPLKNTYSVGEELVIKAEPLNAFGKVIAIRTVEAEFEILNNINCVKITEKSEDAIKLVFMKSGEIKIRMNSPLALRPTVHTFSVVNKK